MTRNELISIRAIPDLDVALRFANALQQWDLARHSRCNIQCARDEFELALKEVAECMFPVAIASRFMPLS